MDTQSSNLRYKIVREDGGYNLLCERNDFKFRWYEYPQDMDHLLTILESDLFTNAIRLKKK